MLKSERHGRILELLQADGRVVAADLQELLGVSAYTIRRDLDELAAEHRLRRVHGGALARSPVAPSYEGRSRHELPGKAATGRAAASLLEPGQVVILDGGSTALRVVDALPPDHTGTFVTHSPPVAAALAARPGIEVLVVGGTLDRRAMVCTGARTVEGYRGITADVLVLGVWSLHAEHGITQDIFEEAELRRTLLSRADRVVGLATREKLGTIAPFAVGPATALTNLATEPGTPAELLRPFEELGVQVVR